MKITMLGDTALSMLKMMGIPPDIPGVLLPEDIPNAQASLKSALLEIEENTQAPSSANPDEGDTEEAEQKRIPLRYRAKPLLDLMSHALEEDKYIKWQEGFSSF